MIYTKVNDLKSISTQDINQMTDADLMQTARNMVFQVNSRLSQIERAGLEEYSPAYKYVEKKYGIGRIDKVKPSDKRKNLIKKIREGRNYLNLKTGTVRGTRETYVETFDDNYTFDEIKDKFFTKVSISDFWDLFKKIRSAYKYLTSDEIESGIHEYFEYESNELPEDEDDREAELEKIALKIGKKINRQKGIKV